MKSSQKIRFVSWGLIGLLLAFNSLAQASETRFRIAGTSDLLKAAPDGTLTWTNASRTGICTVQIAQALAGGTAWVDYIQVPFTKPILSQRMFDPHPPAGMVLIPAGNFTMGDAIGEADTATPTHTVFVSAFYMDKYEVTKALWDEVYNWAINHSYVFDSVELLGYGKDTNHPVQLVNWYDAVKWCNARSEKEGKTPAYYTSAAQKTVYRTGQVDMANAWVKWNRGYRLPTEAEWEKAARGGLSGKRFPWGDTITHSNANYVSSTDFAMGDTSSTSGNHPIYNDERRPYTSPVGSFAANGYGLYDMIGNVWEWCWDRYGAYGSAAQTDPRGFDSGSHRVYRGGSWNDEAWYTRSAYRNNTIDPTVRGNVIGFRPVLPPGQ
jgi:formylglycine-generating enzyme required for sulfatase activity